MPRIFESIGRGIVGAGRAIRGGMPAGGAQQATPPPPATEDATDRPSRLQRFGARLKRDAENAPIERGMRALRARAVKRRAAVRGGTR